MFEKLFSKKNKKKQESIKATIYLKSKVDIESKISEIFATTKVTQRIINGTNNPIELEVFIQKKIDKLIFSSFEAKVGNSMLAKSKVIKTEKAEEKYSDSMASGNAAIYTAIDKSDKNKIIVHIGNIPPKEELIFISNFLNITESSNNFNEYEFDMVDICQCFGACAEGVYIQILEDIVNYINNWKDKPSRINRG